jgi:aminoglycoside phosphotransferase (APT) family kinase protein
MTQTTGHPADQDYAGLSAWLEDHVHGFTGPARITILSAGRSNITYQIVDAQGAGFVLRKPPLTGYQSGSHNVQRECTIISALRDTAIAVPDIAAFCEEPGVLDTPFFVMNLVPGMPLNHDSARNLNPAARQHAGSSLATTMAGLHGLDIDSLGLGGFRRPKTLVERQISGWSRRLDGLGSAVPTEYQTRMTEIAEELLGRQPAPQRESMVHGDFKADNLMVDESGGVAALLDWELTAVGDPLIDLGWLLMWWGDDVCTGPWLSTPLNQDGTFPSGRHIAAEYAELSGLDITRLDFYIAFAYWRLCAINAATRARFLSGAMEGKELDLDRMDAQLAWQIDASRHHLSQSPVPEH